MTDAELLAEVVASVGPDEASRYIAIADHFLQREDRAAAAAALDRAYGLAPDDADLARHRAAILDELAVVEHGIHWRYVPAGTFAMGSTTGDPDERPVHPVALAAFWIADVPISWTQCCALANYSAPPHGWPNDELADRALQFRFIQRNKIRRQYSPPGSRLVDESAPRGESWPMVAAAVSEAAAIEARISTAALRYGLPTEAQWEKAARGGLVGKRYPWGDAPPTAERCDFDHMGVYEIASSRSRPPNGYGVFAMSGGVSEWCADAYDALAYAPAAVRAEADRDGPPRPTREGDPARDPGIARVLRGGSWADCAEAVTVSHRASRAENHEAAPTLGFRLVREAR